MRTRAERLLSSALAGVMLVALLLVLVVAGCLEVVLQWLDQPSHPERNGTR